MQFVPAGVISRLAILQDYCFYRLYYFHTIVHAVTMFLVVLVPDGIDGCDGQFLFTVTVTDIIPAYDYAYRIQPTYCSFFYGGSIIELHATSPVKRLLSQQANEIHSYWGWLFYDTVYVIVHYNECMQPYDCAYFHCL